MGNIIILTECVPDDWTLLEWQKNGIHAEIIFKKVNRICRGIRRLFMKYRLLFFELWYADWEEKIKRADIIVFHVSYLTLHLCERINKINPNAKVIAWYWNCVAQNTNPDWITGNCEKWSFDPENCLKYNMKFNHQYYFKSLVIPPEKTIWDIYYCGSDVGRGKKIAEFYHICREYGMKIQFQVVDPKYNKLPEEIISPRVEYKEIRKQIARSKAILEFVRSGQSGATLRLMESVFFQKKLITDNPRVKEEEFYNENNIFIIGERPMEQLEDFLEREFIQYDKKLLEKYDVKQWLLNFVGE